VENSKKTFFPAAEGEIGHRCGNADIDADISGRGFVAEFASGRAASGEKGRLISVGAATQEFHGFVDGIGVNQTEHGAEDFRVGKLARGRQAIKNGGREKIAGLVAGNSGLAAIENGFCAFADATEISDSTRCLLCGVMTGPICTPASRPLPTRIVEAA
jgi:hypothetical protein